MDAIDKLTETQRQDAAGIGRQYMHYAAEARAADEAGSEDEARELTGKAARCAALLAERYGLDVSDDEGGETRYDALVVLLGDPKREQVIVAFDNVSTSQHEPYLMVDEAPDFYGSYRVGVPANVAVCWSKMAEEWAAVQADMRAAYQLARRESGNHEAVQSLISRFEHADRWKADQAAYQRAEVELDRTVGPRKWAVTQYQLKNGWRTEVRYRIHKRGCSSLAKVIDNGPFEPVHLIRQDHNEQFVRRPEAVSLLSDPDTVACQRCAKELDSAPTKV